VKLRDAKVLYDNSGKTAEEVCKVVGVGRRSFFAYLAQQRDQAYCSGEAHG
jgi:phage antirepressor YoqD-like protein